MPDQYAERVFYELFGFERHYEGDEFPGLLAGGPMLGNSVSSSISNVMNRAGIPGTPHAVRDWFGSALREAGVDSLVIKELMGHESLATTAIYVDVLIKQRSAAVILLPKMTPGADRNDATDAGSNQLSLFD